MQGLTRERQGPLIEKQGPLREGITNIYILIFLVLTDIKSPFLQESLKERKMHLIKRQGPLRDWQGLLKEWQGHPIEKHRLLSNGKGDFSSLRNQTFNIAAMLRDTQDKHEICSSSLAFDIDIIMSIVNAAYQPVYCNTRCNNPSLC